MGRRKFRLIVRKNQERKKYERRKSAAATSLVVSIPKTKLAAPDIFSLEIQLLTSNALPHPWTLTSSIDDKLDRKLILCFVETSQEPPALRYSITIWKDFTWILSAFGKKVTRS